MSRLDGKDPAAPRRRVSRRRILGLGLLAALAVAAVVFRRPLFGGNFGVVEPGRVYRSAQPTTGLPGLIRDRRLASVLNLRGGSPGDPWYVAEVRATHDAGVDFYDFPMCATRRPSRSELLVLIDLLGRCRYPLLIHCKQGADRTGLATALYRMVEQEVGPAEALESFALAYGHVPILGTRHLHEPLEEYATWLDARRLSHTPRRFRLWVEQEYRSDGPTGTPPPLVAGPRNSGFAARIGVGTPTVPVQHR